jgi:hypothetical protein
VPWVFLLKFGRQTRCAHAKGNAFGSGFVSDELLAAFVCLAANFVAAYRPAGTREALPGTMRGISIPRFDRKGPACRAPAKKIPARVNMVDAREKLCGF